MNENRPIGNVYLGRRYTEEEIKQVQFGAFLMPDNKVCSGENHSYYRRFGGNCEDCNKEY